MKAREVAEKLVNDYAQKYVDAALDRGALWSEQLSNAITKELESRDKRIAALWSALEQAHDLISCDSPITAKGVMQTALNADSGDV